MLKTLSQFWNVYRLVYLPYCVFYRAFHLSTRRRAGPFPHPRTESPSTPTTNTSSPVPMLTCNKRLSPDSSNNNNSTKSNKFTAKLHLLYNNNNTNNSNSSNNKWNSHIWMSRSLSSMNNNTMSQMQGRVDCTKERTQWAVGPRKKSMPITTSTTSWTESQ